MHPSTFPDMDKFETETAEGSLPGEAALLTEHERPSLLLNALDNESLIFEDEDVVLLCNSVDGSPPLRPLSCSGWVLS